MGIKPNKQLLQPAKVYEWNPPGYITKNVKYMLPFYQATSGKYVHRVRSAKNHWIHGRLSHTSIEFWCGNQGFLKKGRVHASVEPGEKICATCEGRAIGAGIVGSRQINGNLVKFSPQLIHNKPEQEDATEPN